MIGLTDFNQLDLDPTSTHQHTEDDFMQEVVHVLQVHRPGAGVPELPREFWNRQLCQFAAQFVKPLSAFCVCTGFVWDL